MTVKISKLEFGATIDEKDRCLIEIIYPTDSKDTQDSDFIDIVELKAAIDFLEKEINR